MKMKNIFDLSENVLLKIIANLPVKSVLELRLTCWHMFLVTQCSAFYKKLDINILKIYPNDISLFGKLMEKFGSCVSLGMRFVKNETFERTLGSVQSITEIAIDLEYLYRICMYCRHVRKLVLHLPDEINEEDDFVCLSNLQELKELVLKGVFNVYLDWEASYTQLPVAKLSDILINTKTISKLHLKEIDILNKDDSSKRESSSAGTLISEADHITEWYLYSVSCSELIKFPPSVKVLKCVCTDCVSFENLKKSNMESLTMVDSPCHSRRLEFSSLKTLELLSEIPDNDEDQILFCTPVEVLNLFELAFTEMYFSLFSSKLRVLVLQNVANIDDETLKSIIERSSSLIKLIYIYEGFESNPISFTYLQSLVMTRPTLKITYNGVIVGKKGTNRIISSKAL